MHYPSRTRGTLAACLLIFAGACGGGDQEGTDMAATADTAATMPAPTTEPAAGAPAGAISDPEIAAILAASDTAEILPSRIANEKGQNAQVKQYAQRMITDHGMLSDSLRAMAQQNNIMPTPNPVSQQMQTQTQATVQTLQGLSGAALDSAYVQAMVQSHQTTLNTIDTQLLPAAQNPQLRTALEQKVRPAVAMHLEQAQQIQNSLRQR
jgi:putative membrane protein